MQSGFGLLESGSVTPKNEVNIMVKNAADVIFGGFTYWIFGYAFSFGETWSNPFTGWGNFFVMTNNSTEIGWVYSKFFFQASFATTATTIVSGAMAERIKLEAYIVFSLLNTLVFCFPAHWVWAKHGWLFELGFIDIAGAGPVHLVGGTTGLIATLMLKPRRGRFDKDNPSNPQMGSPTNALLGMFMLWWGWLGFNCGSTFGISGMKWKLAARSAVSTITASMAGGMVGMLVSYILLKRKFNIAFTINGILGSLVGITGFCALAEPWEGYIIGVIGATIAVLCEIILVKLKIDDPVGVVPVHCLAGMWSVLVPGLFARLDEYREALSQPHANGGLFYSGHWRQLGVQASGLLAMMAWTAASSFFFLKLIDLSIGLRVSQQHEILGADIVEHSIGDVNYDKISEKVLDVKDDFDEYEQINVAQENHEYRRVSASRQLRRLTLRLNAVRALEALKEESGTISNGNGPKMNGIGTSGGGAENHNNQMPSPSDDPISDEDLERYMELYGSRRGSNAYGKRYCDTSAARSRKSSCSSVFRISSGVNQSKHNVDTTLARVNEILTRAESNHGYHSDEEESHASNLERLHSQCRDRQFKKFSSLRAPSKHNGALRSNDLNDLSAAKLLLKNEHLQTANKQKADFETAESNIFVSDTGDVTAINEIENETVVTYL
ncbi:putative ammonium transporter 2 [Tubulanus polymorphus]|uniref:putative ammonium transporter 2 n=1 Tax=Tubulanus polymorphus TaxID=672921 RepID=UPI003DA36EDD